jgi:lysophospholipase L1-like esterase
VPSDLTPSLVDGTSSVDAYAERNVECLEIGQCEYGDPDADVEVVIFGDSHAGQWTPALVELATTQGWHVDRLTRSGCSSLTATGVPGCGDWVQRQWTAIEALGPDLVLLSSASDGQFAKAPAAWENRVRRTLREVPEGVPVAVLSETPRAAESVPECLAEHLRDVVACEPPWPAARTVAINERLVDLTADAGAAFVDLTPMLCLADRCPAVAGNVLVYRDAHHVTTAFATSRAGDLLADLDPLVP